MTKEDFLQIFKSGFHKLNLIELKKVCDCKNKFGRKYEKYLGLFQFVPPEQVWMDKQPINYDYLKDLLKQFDEQLSNCIVRKFTKKYYKKENLVKKEVIRYIFDIIPKNVISFKFDINKKTMRIVVIGYCLKK